MTISYPRSLPSELTIEQCTFGAQSVVAVSKSPFTGEEQIQAHQGQWWMADVKAAVMNRANAAAVQAWLLSLNGKEKTILFGDPGGPSARGSASTTPGSPVVSGGSQTGDSLAITGAATNATGYLLAGDYIQLGTGSSSHMHQVLEDVNTDGSGAATLTIWPDLRESPSNGAAVTVDDAKALMRLDQNSVEWAETTVLYRVQFKLVEAL